MSIIPPNHTKQALREGRQVIGSFIVEIRQPSIMQVMANAGFDFVTIDNEHGAFSIETIADLCRAAVYMGITPIVRVPDTAYPYLCQTLDVGAQGLMTPRVASAEQVRQIVQTITYPPECVRGSVTERGLTQLKGGAIAELIPQITNERMLIVQIETRGALEAIEEIASIPGVDAALIGPLDLSIALGVPGEVDHPIMRAAIEKTISACQRHGVAPAIHMNNLQLAVDWARKGMRLISYSSETTLLSRAGEEAIAQIKRQ